MVMRSCRFWYETSGNGSILKKGYQNSDFLFDRVPNLVLERLVVQKDPEKTLKSGQNLVQGPKYRVWAHVLNPTRLLIKTRVRAIKKSMRIEEKHQKNEHETKVEKKKAFQDRFFIDFAEIE